MKTVLTLISRISGDAEVAGTLAIGAPGASYAAALSQLSNKSASARPSAVQTALLVRSMKMEKMKSQELRR